MTVLWLVIVLALAACSQQDIPAPTDKPAPTRAAESTDSPTAAPIEATPTNSTATERLLIDQDVPLPGLHQDRTALMAASGNCSACHTGLDDSAGRDVSFDSQWRSSMHAFAAIDPYWQASVSAEVSENPELAAVIEDKCATCHMPMAHFDATANGEAAAVLGDGFLDPVNPLHDLAMDAVSCTACHQIKADKFGTAESLSGGFLIDRQVTTYGERVVYGPLPIGQQPANVMASASGFLAVQSEHIADSAMCATCHTLYTPYLDASGAVAGEFPEQMVYFEWENSSFSDSHSCQDCHMPKVDEDIAISTVIGQPKPYLRLHNFVGANRFMLDLVEANATALGVRAETAQLEAARSSILDLLQTQTAEVMVANSSLADGLLTLDVVVTSQTGHKFPTGFPSRRAWLHVTVTNASGEVVFESGAVNANGLIEGNDNDLDAALYEPHYNLITSPEQVQIYETILETTEGEVTTTLLSGAGYAKDNRLLPAGFDPQAVIPETATHGLAAEDADFAGGGDAVRYQIDVSGVERPLTVTVQLNYQSIGFRWAENLRLFGTHETEAFVGLYDAAVNLPVVVASVEVEVGE